MLNYATTHREAAMSALARFRSAAAPALRPVRRGLGSAGRLRRKGRFFRGGIEGICMELRGTIDCGPILREFGAHVGEGTTIYGPLHVMNADGDFSNLWIGDRVYLGTNILIDLADRVHIGHDVSIGMRSNLITSFDVGPGPLSVKRPRQQGPITIEDGAYLRTATTVLHGVTVGVEATVGAHCLVRKAVPAHGTFVSPEGHFEDAS